MTKEQEQPCLRWRNTPKPLGFSIQHDERLRDFLFGDDVMGHVSPMSSRRETSWFWYVPEGVDEVPAFNWLTDNDPVNTKKEAMDALAQYVKSHLFKKKPKGFE